MPYSTGTCWEGCLPLSEKRSKKQSKTTTTTKTNVQPLSSSRQELCEVMESLGSKENTSFDLSMLSLPTLVYRVQQQEQSSIFIREFILLRAACIYASHDVWLVCPQSHSTCLRKISETTSQRKTGEMRLLRSLEGFDKLLLFLPSKPNIVSDCII